MKKNLQKNSYSQLIKDITELYERICSDGLYLNQELLDKGLAQPVY